MTDLFQQSEKVLANPQQEEQLRCRICYDTARPLISVCACSGTIAYVHEDCVLDWITKKIESADRVQIPACQICHDRFSARMKVGKKKVCTRLLVEKIRKLPVWDLAAMVVHTVVLMLVLFFLVRFVVLAVAGELVVSDLGLGDTLVKIFTNFVCQIYVIMYFAQAVKDKKWLINESMVQIVEVTLRPRVVVKK